MNGVVCDSAHYGEGTSNAGEAEGAGNAEGAGKAEGAEVVWRSVAAEPAWRGVAERATLAALLRCCVREVAGPRGQVWAAAPYLLLRLAGTLIRVPASGGIALRFDGDAERLWHGAWRPLSADHLVRLVEAELGEIPPVDAERDELRAVNAEPEEIRPVEGEPGEARPRENEPGEVQPVETEPTEIRPVEGEPGDARPGEAELGEVHPIGGEPGEVRPDEVQPVEARPGGTGPGEVQSVGGEAEEIRAVEGEVGAASGDGGAGDFGAGREDSVAGRLALRRNEEFAGQVAASRAAIAVMLRERAGAKPPQDPWLASEQALVLGHPFHPSPKSRGGAGWARYAPEAHAAFPLRLLGVRDDVLATGGDSGALDGLGEAPPGYTLLPAHPWQLELLAAELAAPFADGRLVDLGDAALPAVPTSSVRTVYEPAIGKCLKFSLDVRITNCVRKNAWYELASAAEVSARLTPVFADLARRLPGTRWLPEPGYRSARLRTRLLEGLGVIVRSSPWEVAGPGVTPILAGTLAALGAVPDGEAPEPAAVVTALRREPVRWWGAYVDHVALPVLDAYFGHGVVLEPHLQNVLVGIDADGMPIEAIFRDMEGTKLVEGRHDLSGLPDPVTRAATYDAARGWNRVVYCIMVNHLPEIAATVAGTAAPHARDDLLHELWADARGRVARHAGRGRLPLPLRDLLAGAPLPAKANLTTRWARSADRDAGYVPVANPFAGVPA
ncbi:IucA/IucC family protein [Sphaerisporangium sp. NPDC005289]|uniref:IucA/IucC family protein n=1 Tax=Sphaerisporangium sp. NPDC005289 TaxID=3155247 RepID=UPI0033B9A1BB